MEGLIVSLARNTDLEGVVSSMEQMEDRFNKKFQYPYVFLNDVPFDDTFKKYFVNYPKSTINQRFCMTGG